MTKKFAVRPLAFLHDRGSHACRVIARLRPGMGERQAEIEMSTIAARLSAHYPVTKTGVSVEVRWPLNDLVGEDSKALLAISAGAILVLQIARANWPTSLLVARQRPNARSQCAWRLAARAGRSFI